MWAVPVGAGVRCALSIANIITRALGDEHYTVYGLLLIASTFTCTSGALSYPTHRLKGLRESRYCQRIVQHNPSTDHLPYLLGKLYYVSK